MHLERRVSAFSMKSVILFSFFTIILAEEKESTLQDLSRRRADSFGVYAHHFKYGFPLIHVLTTAPMSHPSLVAMYPTLGKQRYGFQSNRGSQIFGRRKPQKKRMRRTKKKIPTVTKLRITKHRNNFIRK